MQMNHKLSAAIAAVLAVQAAPVFAADDLALEEVVVTAQRRSENIQDVPIAIQALTGETLNQLKVTTVEEFIKYLPNVTLGSAGPGEGNIYMRGLSVGVGGTQGSGTVGQWPNVAVYLDEQSTSIPGRNLNVYAADLERIEVLEGPQGTLFGAGAQAGVLRYITNKPKLGVTEGSVTAGYGTTAHGANNSDLTAVLNLPIGEKTAIRAVIYSDSKGGYIDNVPGTFTRRGTDLGFAQRTGGIVPTDSVVINNYDIASRDINDVNYKGIRVGIAHEINDDWNVLLTQSYQQMDVGGVFYQHPYASDCPTPSNAASCTTAATGTVLGKPLGELQVNLFSDTHTDDKFSNTALVVNGKVGALDLVYSGAYLTRNAYQQGDYTNYARGVWGTYYQCTGFSGASVNKCYTPKSQWLDWNDSVSQSHEIRLTTKQEGRIRAVGGLFWEKREIMATTDWQYKSVPECVVGGPGSCFQPLDPSVALKFQSASVNHRYLRNSSVGFFNDFQRTYTQKAAFASVDVDVMENLTLTVGTRYYDIKNQMLGANMGSFYCKNYQAVSTKSGPCNGPANGLAPYGTNLNEQAENQNSANGFRSRVNLSWKVSDDVLLYATWSQGYRPGGFNRGSSCQLRSVVTSPTGAVSGGARQWCVPFSFKSDDLVNKEIGWKTNLMGNRIVFNGAIYQEDWKDVQTGIFAPQLGLGNLTVGLNGPTYRVQGAQMQITARATEGLTIQGSASYNKTELTNSPQLIGNIPGSPSFGQPITTAFVGGVNPVVTVKDVFGVQGQRTAMSPKLQANARARYEWSMGEYDYYWQVGFSHQAASFSSATAVNRYEMPSWTQWDASAGVAMGNWSVEVVGSNLTDLNKSLLTNASQFIVTETVQRPRTLGVRIGYKFGE